MIHFQEFSPKDGQDKLDFLMKADLSARGFNIIGMFDNIKTVEKMRAKIREINELAAHDPCVCKYYWILNDDIIVGVITLRPALNGFWLHNAGHIGIAIDAPHRCKNYGTAALKKMCELANNEFGIKDIISVALVDNAASRTMIEKAGGQYWDTVTAADGEEIARYWIKTK